MNDHLILQHLDKPTRYLFFTKTDAMVVIIPFFLGVLSESVVLMILIPMLSILVLRFIKKNVDVDNLPSTLYWFLDYGADDDDIFPHSYIREFLG